ncbi:ABC-F family ATP-binding cassette domain-containing protein [Bradyrhizobium australiense]|uniref:ABC-F family ATP-binding cassette domain-containing protein n=1 Tax=Bradyrhizobium australiense TaxID=2721161 RepID=A0A7Y4GV82_9BRAD|nr:ABC-F family ATP-binding cassette domain-containing protein [Bradyrhizobium australiense]NOJ41967.1 ABC-F family ATP-binding cassette domain-containing protein [Bradyrhizobium australiense]
MPAFLVLDSISLATPDRRPLFDGLTLAIGRECTGLVGRNGCGKSTLLRLIAGEIEPAGGSLQRIGSIGMLAQLTDERLMAGEALGVASGLARLRRLERGEGSIDDAAEADWTLEARIQAALAEAGLPSLPLDRPIASLSGGERTRLALARLLIEAPDVLLLDEPTNNLDTDGRQAVAQLIERWQGGVLVASHDRALLERVDRIVELAPVGVTQFGGAWRAFAEAREASRARAADDLDRASDALRNTARALQKAREKKARRDKVGRAWRAKGVEDKMFMDREKERAENSAARESGLASRLLSERTEALEMAKAHVEILTPLSIELPRTHLPSGRELIAFRDVVMAFGKRHLFGPLSFDVRGPERIAIRGANGSGKTTLFRLLTGELKPASGDISRLTDRIAVLDQHIGLLDPAASILDNLRRLNPELSANAAHATLARFAFRNNAALQIAATLSGGERLRAGLACVFARPQPPFLLLLDEPTNHLDLASIEELENALKGFDGALIAVSHDEAFLKEIGIGRQIVLV